MSSSECLRVRGLGASWGADPVLTDVDLDVADGEFVVLMGPNGSGKTTLLRCLVGLEAPTHGTVSLRGRNLRGVPTHRRGVGMLFQEPALFPHRSVWENVAYGLAVLRRPRADIDRRVEEMLRLLHLESLADRAPQALSGGERQRVALARTLAPEPPLVLLDEPFASVDAEIRRDLRSAFRRALSATRTAAIHVTHDREEGLLLADRVVLLSGGRVVQHGSPPEVYGAPASADSARFLGYNVLVESGRAMAIAPIDVEIRPLGESNRTGTVTLSGFAGGSHLVEVELEGGERLEGRLPLGAIPPAVGTRVGLRWRRSVALPGAPV
ncbi:MAG: ABC transporter ATP-binding protein [Thermoplasmata archaeon]|nr:ABC transporter ATP-binding protein [Thermoplasmata archaeon]MCI4362309.1 ABC transporter ATP-binding protein [Thermoplasmata archaeon]